MWFISLKLFLFFVGTCSAQYYTGYTTGYETSLGPSPSTTTAAPLYCDAEKCEQHDVLIRDLEQKVNDLVAGFEILQGQNDELQSKNEVIMAELLEVKTENDALRDDVSYLQGMWLIFFQIIRIFFKKLFSYSNKIKICIF